MATKLLFSLFLLLSYIIRLLRELLSIGTLLLASGGLVHPALLIQKSLLGTTNRGLVLILRLNLRSRVLDLTGLVDVTVLDCF